MPGASTWFLSHSPSSHFHLLHLIFFLFLLSASVSAKPTNRTIDDTFGDSSDPSIKPLFLPRTSGVWENASCKTCAIQPETSKAFRGTWTAATYNKGLGNVSVTLPFTGTAIHVFFILANDQGPGITTTTECNFTLDGQPAGSFVHRPTTSKALQYNESALVFSEKGLRNRKHELLISTSGVDHDVFVNFDYAIYTFDDNPDSTSGVVPPISTSTGPNSGSPTSKSQNAGSTQSNPTAVVLGTVLGGVAALAAAGLIIYFYRRRRKLERHFEVGGGGVESNSTQHHPPQPNTASLPTPGPIPPQTPPWNTNANQNPAVRASRALSDEVDMVSYIGQDNYTTLPTGEVVLSAATRPSHRYTRTPSSIYTGRPRTLVLHNHDRDSVLPMSPTTVNMQRTRELETQVQGIKREMRYLEVQAAEERGYNGGYGYEGENKSLGEQIQEMREQVRMLQAQIQPPPPGYTVTPTAF